MITMENYDIMNYLAFFMLYTWHNDAIRTAGLDPMGEQLDAEIRGFRPGAG